MRIWYHNKFDQARRALTAAGGEVRIGRGPENDLVLDSPFVATEAAVLSRRGDAWELVVLGNNVVTVESAARPGEGPSRTSLRRGGRASLAGGETIELFPYTLRIEGAGREEVARDDRRRALDAELSAALGEIHRELVERMGLVRDLRSTTEVSPESLLTLERHIDEIAATRGFMGSVGLIDHAAASCLRLELLAGLLEDAAGGEEDVWEVGGAWSRLVSAVPERERELRAAVARVRGLLGADDRDDVSGRVAAVESGYWPLWESRLSTEIAADVRSYLAARYFKKQVKDIVFGYGPLEDLLRNPSITEIMVVDRDNIFVEKLGVLENTGRRFVNDEVTLTIISRIVARVGRTIDRSRPLVDARLADGSRVNAVIPPLAVRGPCLTIRKFPTRRLTADDLVASGGLTEAASQFLRAAVLARKNIVVSGGTGTGKTTLLNVLSGHIPDKERIVTIEDTAELRLAKEHVVRLETRDANVEGAGAYTIRDLIRNALRMRPDRIVVGECRGPEALDMTQAMNTGHAGSMTTLHANTPIDALLRLEVLVQMAAPLPVSSIRRQIAAAIDLIVQLTRGRDGRRYVSHIAEVEGPPEDGRELRVKELFAIDRDDATAGGAALAPTGLLPTFMDELIESGRLNLETFYR